MKDQQKEKRSLYITASLCFAIAYSVYCFVILPLYFSLEANVNFADGILPELVGYLGTAIENVAIFVFYGIVIYAIYRFGYKASRGVIAVFAAAAVYKYSANVVMTWVRYKVIPSNWGWDLFNVAYYTAFELIMLLIVLAIVKRIIARGRSEEQGELSFSGAYDKTNYLMRASLVCGVVTASVKAFGNLINDIFYIADYGISEYFTIFGGVLLNYVSALILGVVCYAVSAFVAAHKYSKNRESVKV